MIYLDNMVKSGAIVFWASTHVRDELDGIPAKYRQSHLDVYESVYHIAAHPTTNWIDDNPHSNTYQQATAHPMYSAIRRILPQEIDARLIFQTYANGVRDFLTLDERTIIRYRKELQSEVGINTWTPSGFVENIVARSN
jgi:hypothetical protein